MSQQSSNLITVERPAVPALAQEMAPLVAAARAYRVVDVETHGEALTRIKVLRDAERKISEDFEPTRRKLDEAKKAVLAQRDGYLGPLVEARGIYDRAASSYEREQRELAAAEERRLAEEARKREEERSLQDAIDAEAAGDPEEAEEILARPVQVPVVRVEAQVAKVKGVTTRNTFSARIRDALALVRYVAAHPEWISLLEDEALMEHHPNLNRLAISQRHSLNIPGVEVVETEGRSTRS